MSRPALARSIWILVAVGAAALLLILLLRPIEVRQTAFPGGETWRPRPILPDRPGHVTLLAPIGGLSEVWIRRAGSTEPGAIAGSLRPAGGGPAIEAAGEPVVRGGRAYYRFAFPSIPDSAGRRFDLTLAPPAGSAAGATPAVIEAPGRFYPDGDPADRRQIPFDAVYSTAGWRVALDLGARLGGVGDQRWAPAGLIPALFAVEVALLAGLLLLTRRVGRPA